MMSDTPEPVEAAEPLETAEPVEAVPNGTPEPESVEEPAALVDTDDEKPNEAAKWRRKLRDTEKVRDELAARVEALQRGQVEQLLAATGVKAEAVYAVADLPSLLDGEGLVDAAKVKAALAEAKNRFGIHVRGKGTVVPGVGNQPARPKPSDGFVDAFKPRRK